ncbi:MAG: isopentenyl phosphate kinase [Anaerolineales bacterium]
MRKPVFLKLGGSLITDKTHAYTPRLDKLADLATEIAHALRTHPDLLLLLGHGSGSFGHTAAKEYGTKDGLPARLVAAGHSPSSQGKQQETEAGRYWQGFAEVWYQASALNRYVIQALHDAGLPAVTFSPLAGVWSKANQVAQWDVSHIEAALEHGLLPVVHGDVIFDHAKGGTILSTEDLFAYLARILRPRQILLAGLEAGVWADFPARRHIVKKVTRASFDSVSQGVGKAAGADVTGGMEAKVRQMLDLVEQAPGLTVQIFSGEPKGNLERALEGEILGTLIESNES